MQKILRIGLVAGEASGDLLGAALITAIKAQFPNTFFEGVGGPLMVGAGMKLLYPMEPLSVMGLVEPLKNFPTLIRIRKGLRNHFTTHPPDGFVGIDAPDFNLGLELSLRKHEIKTLHYVSPSVWAWRRGRVKKIAQAVDHMLTLLPFEANFYAAHGVPVTFVGHPLADELPLVTDGDQAKRELGISDSGGPIVAILPGSRKGEIKYMGRLFLETARQCSEVIPDILFVLPIANIVCAREVDLLLSEFPDLSVKVINGQSHHAMAAADAVLLTSGTAALEAMLLKKPMVVGYRTGWFTHAIVSRMLDVPYVSLPNLLAGKEIVPELLQKEASVENLTNQLLTILQSPSAQTNLIREFERLHRTLRGNASATAARTVLSLINGDGTVGENS